jgi:hypothetical protein
MFEQGYGRIVNVSGAIAAASGASGFHGGVPW